MEEKNEKKMKKKIDDCFKTPNAYYYRVGSESVIRYPLKETQMNVTII